MKRLRLHLILMLMGMLSTGNVLAAKPAVEKPAGCDVCGMDRVSLAASRVAGIYVALIKVRASCTFTKLISVLVLWPYKSFWMGA